MALTVPEAYLAIFREAGPIGHYHFRVASKLYERFAAMEYRFAAEAARRDAIEKGINLDAEFPPADFDDEGDFDPDIVPRGRAELPAAQLQQAAEFALHAANVFIATVSDACNRTLAEAKRRDKAARKAKRNVDERAMDRRRRMRGADDDDDESRGY